MIKVFDQIPSLMLERCGFPTNYNLLNDDQKDLLEFIYEMVPKAQETRIDDIQEDLDYLTDDIQALKENLDNLIKKIQRS